MRRILSFIAMVPLLVHNPLRAQPQTDLWELAKGQQADHRFSTLFTAQDVRQHLSTDEGLSKAIDWCKQTAVTKVYIETYRDGYQAEHAALAEAMARFQAAGLRVSGCITPTGIGKASSGWKTVSCYTDRATQDQVRSIFEFAASLFDEIMIDDFWFTDCACPECEAGRKERVIRIGNRTYPVRGDTWEDYRCELMVHLSRDAVLGPSKKVNPNTRLIIKYPQWYDRFHERGYEVLRETQAFDHIWVGTESRDYNDPRWGGTVQYESYFIMRWLGNIGGGKCGGGWFDWLGTTEETYVEQARQTVLGGARESMLFCYGGLQETTGPKNIQALRMNILELLTVARAVRARDIMGIAAYKPANSHPETEGRVFDFVGMLGLPLVPCHDFPTNAPAAFFSIHALKDRDFAAKLADFVRAGKTVLLTDGLMDRLRGSVALSGTNVWPLRVKGDPKSLLLMSAAELNELRVPLLRPFQSRFEAPGQVALYLFKDGSSVIGNFNNKPVVVRLNGNPATIPARGWTHSWKN